MRKEPFDDCLFDYLDVIDHPFTLGDLFKTTGIKKPEKKEEDIRQLITSLHNFVADNGVFHPKVSFLKDIPLRIMPSEFEIKKEILMPGHCFLPFFPFTMPDDGMSLTYNDIPLKTKTISFKWEELFPYFSLMDMEKIPIQNFEDILKGNSKLKVRVFDFSEFYKSNAFNYGDSIIAKSIDFPACAFSIRYDPRENYLSHIFEIEKFDKVFMKTLKEVLKQGLVFPNAEKQLVYTYYYLKQNPNYSYLWNQPGTPVVRLLKGNEEITFTAISDGRTVFHFVDQNPEDLVEYPDFEEILEEEANEDIDFETIDGILQFLGNNNSITTVRGLLLDQLSNREKYNYKKIEDYLFDGAIKPYMPAILNRDFKKLVKQEYDELQKTFDLKYAYLPVTTARKKILEQMLYISTFLRSLDANMIELDDLPKDDMVRLGQLDQAFHEALEGLEINQLEGQNDGEGVKSIIRIIDVVGKELPGVLNIIRKKLGIKD